MAYLSVNFFVRLANVVPGIVGRSKLNISRHTLTTLISDVLNNFIRNLLTQKSNDLISRRLSGYTKHWYTFGLD